MRNSIIFKNITDGVFPSVDYFLIFPVLDAEKMKTDKKIKRKFHHWWNFKNVIFVFLLIKLSVCGW